jgi:hypothetical protein
MFAVESASINGVQCDPYFASTVLAGKKANESITFSDDIFRENGIDIMYTDIELTFRVYDDDDWAADDVVYTTVHIYPYGEENAARFVRDAQDSDIVLVDNEYVTAIVTGFEQDSIWGYTANLFLVNKTDSTVMFTVDDVSINGFMADPFYAESVASGKCAFSAIEWSDSDLTENDITEVQEIEFKFRAYNEDEWLDDDYANKKVTLNP